MGKLAGPGRFSLAGRSVLFLFVALCLSVYVRVSLQRALRPTWPMCSFEGPALPVRDNERRLDIEARSFSSVVGSFVVFALKRRNGIIIIIDRRRSKVKPCKPCDADCPLAQGHWPTDAAAAQPSRRRGRDGRRRDGEGAEREGAEREGAEGGDRRVSRVGSARLTRSKIARLAPAGRSAWRGAPTVCFTSTVRTFSALLNKPQPCRSRQCAPHPGSQSRSLASTPVIESLSKVCYPAYADPPTAGGRPRKSAIHPPLTLDHCCGSSPRSSQERLQPPTMTATEFT